MTVSEQMDLIDAPGEADAFILPGLRPETRWHVTRQLFYWLIEMEHEGRKVTTSTIGHQPQQGDAHLIKLERRHFHEPE